MAMESTGAPGAARTGGHSHVFTVTLGALILIAGFATVAGWTPWPLVALTSLACLMAIASRVGYVIGLAVTILVAFGAIVALLLVAAAAWLAILPTVGVTFTVLGEAAIILRSRTPVRAEVGLRSLRWDLAASCTGLVVWLGALVVSVRVPLDERLGWVMRNDSLNNLVYAHYILREHGVELRADLNPTPLPAALVALGIASGRGTGSAVSALNHDLVGMGLTWAALIGLASVVMGLTASAIVRGTARPGFASRAAGAGASILALSWYVTGYPIEYGFLNLDVVIPVLLASLLLALRSRRLPWVSVSGLLVAATLMLATWSPLVVVPLALLLLAVVRGRSELLRSSRLGIVVMAGSALQLVGYGIFGTLPAYFAQRSALAGLGGIYADNYYVVFVAGAAVIALGFFVFRADRAKFLVVSATVVASWLSLGLLLFISRRNSTPWTYYPIKLAYFSTVIFLVMLMGMAVTFLAQRASRVVIVRVGALVLVALVAALLAAVPPVDKGLVRINPIVRLVVSHPDEKYVQPGTAAQVLSRSAAPAILWGSRVPDESFTNLWLLQLRADTLSGTSKLRLAAYNQLVDRSTKSLCTIIGLVGSASTVVYTDDARLPSKVASTCPGMHARFLSPPDLSGRS